ncbi:hypothetical protein ADUPG1_011837 [Aduncisulcus paluster]|uniref:Protein kinase domain-containing protein n=1 Tax=Aduncisulcus paluster TaxID=2918883 RepID=A0ABQ5JZN8_9EUKA|nr:hypothetical protein ADUPG1_011837 [Aduncisulcus paluster]
MRKKKESIHSRKNSLIIFGSVEGSDRHSVSADLGPLITVPILSNPDNISLHTFSEDSIFGSVSDVDKHVDWQHLVRVKGIEIPCFLRVIIDKKRARPIDSSGIHSLFHSSSQSSLPIYLTQDSEVLVKERVVSSAFHDEDFIRACEQDFALQIELFSHSSGEPRIPQPLCILDLLDSKGIYGFITENCVGGNVFSFISAWCRRDSTLFASLCCASIAVGCIECLDDLLGTKPSFVHGEINPANFLIRITSKGYCSLVLNPLLPSQQMYYEEGELGASDQWSMERKSEVMMAVNFTEDPMNVYYAYELLCHDSPSEFSDCYSLGMTLYALFKGSHPFSDNKRIKKARLSGLSTDPLLREIHEKDQLPKIGQCEMFDRLEQARYSRIHMCLESVYRGLTRRECKKRLSIHEVRKMTDSIKHLLPPIGQGWIC